MAQNKKKQPASIYARVVKVLSSRYFFYSILFLAIIQGLWYALSFQPGLFDESKHIGKIIIYSHHLNPLLGAQDPSWDHFGVVSRDASYFFYYAMGWPLRLIRFFTQDTTIQIVGLRMVCLSFFTAGLVVFRKVLLATRQSSSALVNLSILFLVLTPAFGPLAGAVNYDNLVFLMFAVLLLYSLKVIQSSEVSFMSIAKVLTIGLVTMLVKWAAIALVIPVIVYLACDLYSKHKQEAVSLLVSSFKKLPKVQILFVLFGLVVLLGLFIERPVLNTLRYGGADPSCKKVLNDERCRQFADYRIYAEVDARKPKNFQPILPPKYFMTLWFPRMVNTQTTLLPWRSNELTPALPIIENMYFMYAIIGPLIIVLFLRAMWKNLSYRYLLVVACGYALLLLLFLYRSYVRHAIPAAINARYLLPVLPIFIYFSGVSLSAFLGNAKRTKLVTLAVVVLLMTQGGGIVTHALTAPSNLYWENSTVRSVNNRFRLILSPVTKERF